MMKLIYLLPFLSVIVLQPTIANALSPEQIQKIAQSVTLKIETTGNGTKSSGSGVAIQKQGNNYLLVTNAHVVCSNRNYLKNCDKHPNYQIVTPDRQSHTVTETAVKVLPNLDLALIQFQSDRNYPVATLGNSDSIAIDEPIYAAGFPATKSRFSFYHGTIVASVSNRLTGDRGGYTVIYDASTSPGMSGGGVFNRQGQIIAIHGQGDRYREGTETNVFHDQIRKDLNPNWGNIYNAIVDQKIGINRGIPINYLLRQGSSFGFGANPGNSQTQTLFNPTTADEWFVIALNKAIYPDMDRLAQDKQQAIQDCSQAIKLKSDYLMAYYLRARLWNQTNVADRELNDYQTIARLQPTSALKYMVRSAARLQTRNFDGALSDVNQAIKIDPDRALAYTMRAGLYLSNNPSMAIADSDRAIKLDPNNFINFISRAAAKRRLADIPGAIADLDRAVAINPVAETYRPYLGLGNSNTAAQTQTIEPNSAQFYIASANQKQLRGDLKGALADYDLAIKVQPTALIFAARAMFKKQRLEDLRGAEVDLSRAIELRSDEPYFYLLRASLREVKNKKGAMSDLQQAAKIYKQRGDEKTYSTILRLISSLSQ